MQPWGARPLRTKCLLRLVAGRRVHKGVLLPTSNAFDERQDVNARRSGAVVQSCDGHEPSQDRWLRRSLQRPDPMILQFTA